MASLQSALELVNKAVQLDTAGKVQEAISIYQLAIEHLYQVTNKQLDRNTNELVKAKIQEYSKRVDYLKATLNLSPSSATPSISLFPSTPTSTSSTVNSSQSTPQSKDDMIKDALTYVNQAIKMESENRISDAVMLYTRSSDLLYQASLAENDIEVRLMLNQKKQEYQSRADELKSKLSPNVQSSNMFSTSPASSHSDLPFPEAEFSMYSSIELSSTSSEYIDMAINYTTEAIKEDDVHNYTKAIPLYEASIQYFNAALQCENNEQVKRLIMEKMTNSKVRCEFLKNKINYQGQSNQNMNIPFSLKPGGKYKDPVRKKTVMEKLVKTIRGPKNISDHWL